MKDTSNMSEGEFTRYITYNSGVGKEYFSIKASIPDGAFHGSGKGGSSQAETLGELRDKLSDSLTVKDGRRGLKEGDMMTRTHYEKVMDALEGYIRAIGEGAKPEDFVERYKN